MAGIENWFSFKNEEQRKKEKEEYDRRLFPFGEDQIKTVRNLLKEVIRQHDDEITFYQYLVCKDLLQRRETSQIDADAISGCLKATKYTMKKKNREDLFSLLALCECDLKIDERLDYPDVEVIRKRAEELKEV